MALEKRSGLEKLKIPCICVDSSRFLEAADLSSVGICAPSQCIDFTQDDYTVSMVIHLCPRPTKNAFVVFTGGQPIDASGTIAKRYFHRVTWNPNNAHVISVSDPIHFTDKFIRLGFYAIDLFGPRLIPTLLNKLLSLLNVTEACAIGASAGGWVTLKVLSENIVPTLKMGIFICGQINPTLPGTKSNCYETEKALDTKITWDIDLRALQGYRLFYIQNELDNHFYKTQFKPFSEELKAVGGKMFLYNTPPEVVLSDHHKYGVPQKMIEGIFQVMNSETPSAEEQAELDRHRFRPY